MKVSAKPAIPFLAMNRYYICEFRKPNTFIEYVIGSINGKNRNNEHIELRRSISDEALAKGRASHEACIIDINCLKFPVMGITITGCHRSIFNLYGLVGKREYDFEYNVGEPVQLAFEQAREEIVEHICSHRWAGQTGASPAYFRKMHGSKKTMAELMEGIGFLGKWPF